MTVTPEKLKEWERLAWDSLPHEEEDAEGDLYMIEPDPENVAAFRAVAAEAVGSLVNEVEAQRLELRQLSEEIAAVREQLRGKALEGMPIEIARGHITEIETEFPTRTLYGMMGESMRVPDGVANVTLGIMSVSGKPTRVTVPLTSTVEDALQLSRGMMDTWRIVLVRK